MSEPPDPLASMRKAESARRRAIWTAVVIAILCATIIPDSLTYFFGIPTIGGWLVAVGFYLLFNRIFRFDPKCPNCGNKVGRTATKCRACGTALNPS